MNKYRRYMILLGAFLSLPVSAFNFEKKENNYKAALNEAVKAFGKNTLIESEDVTLNFGRTKPKNMYGESIYLVENNAVVPFTVRTKSNDFNSLLLLSQNPVTSETTIIAKYNVNESFAGKISGRIKLNCKNHRCKIWAITNNKHGFKYTNKQAGFFGCIYSEG